MMLSKHRTENDPDQTVRMRKLTCVFFVHIGKRLLSGDNASLYVA